MFCSFLCCLASGLFMFAFGFTIGDGNLALSSLLGLSAIYCLLFANVVAIHSLHASRK